MPYRSLLERQIELAVTILKNGGLVAFPTDTVYGLGADSRNDRAVDRVFKAKKRPHGMALPLLIADKSELTKVAAAVPDLAWKLADRFFPGGLTLVLKKAERVSNAVTAGGDTVAVRAPDHAIPVALIRGLGSPIVGTSANLSGRPSPATADEVCRQLGAEIDLIIDGGNCPGGIESTVVDVSGETPFIVREGAVSRQEIEAVYGSPVPVIQKQNVQ